MRSKDQTEVEWCMRAAGQVVREKPEVPDDETLRLRAALTLEEVLEKAKALGFHLHASCCGCDVAKVSNIDIDDAYEPNIVEIADACADIIVVVLGTLSALGIDADAVLDEVHRANKAKFPGGKAILREDGKYLKPEGWQPPDIAGVLKAQGWSG
jgi:predicted HAD superfamily Cof-like phosphohydrolase